MRHPPKRPTAKTRVKTRARRCAPPATPRPRAAATDDERACRIARLRALKNKLTHRLDRIDELLDAELIAARESKTLYAVIGQAVQVAEGRPQTADDLKRVERQLRKATARALRRRDPSGDKARVAQRAKQHETDRMRNQNMPYRRRTVETEEWYGQPPPEELADPGPPVPTLVGDDDLGDPEDDLDEPDDDIYDDEDDEE